MSSRFSLPASTLCLTHLPVKREELLLVQLQYAVKSHASYCEDYLADRPVQQAALHTAQVTQHFFQSIVAYLDDELAMLTSFSLLAKQMLLLLSNQVVHICEVEGIVAVCWPQLVEVVG